MGPVLARMGTLAPTGASALAFAWYPAPGTANLVSCARRPGLGDGAGDRARVDHVAGDVAEEEGQARVAPRDAGEADLLAGPAVVVAGGRDGKAAGVGRPRGVDGDAVGAPACGRLPTRARRSPTRRRLASSLPRSARHSPALWEAILALGQGSLA